MNEQEIENIPKREINIPERNMKIGMKGILNS